MNRDSVIAWLTTMTDKQFIEFFYDAVCDRDTSERKGECGHLVLANTCQMEGEERDTVFLALPDRDENSDEWAKDAPICQTGLCVECGSSVRCIAKHAICPVCRAKVYCT